MGVEEKISSSDTAKEILDLGVIFPEYNHGNELSQLKFQLADLLGTYGSAEDSRSWYVKLLTGKKKHQEELEKSARRNLEKSVTEYVERGVFKQHQEEIDGYKKIKSGMPQDPKILKFEDKRRDECFYSTSVFVSTNLITRDIFSARVEKKGDLYQVTYEHSEFDLGFDVRGRKEINHYRTKNEEFYKERETAHQKALDYLKSGLTSIFRNENWDTSKLSFQVIEK